MQRRCIWRQLVPNSVNLSKLRQAALRGSDDSSRGAAASARRGAAVHSRLFLPETPVPWACFKYMCATLVLDFLFGDVAAERVQGWCALENRRAIQALKKLGAVPGAIVHDYPHFDHPRDGQLWTIFAEAWRNRRLG